MRRADAFTRALAIVGAARADMLHALSADNDDFLILVIENATQYATTTKGK